MYGQHRWVSLSLLSSSVHQDTEQLLDEYMADMMQIPMRHSLREQTLGPFCERGASNA
jgi:hypothetical protein